MARHSLLPNLYLAFESKHQSELDVGAPYEIRAEWDAVDGPQWPHSLSLLLDKLEKLDQNPIPTILPPPVLRFTLLQCEPSGLCGKLGKLLNDKPVWCQELIMLEAANAAGMFVRC